MKKRHYSIILLFIAILVLPGCGLFNQDEESDPSTDGDGTLMGETLENPTGGEVTAEEVEATLPAFDGSGVGPAPTETPSIVGDLEGAISGLSDKITIPPTVEELLEKYPELAALQANLDLTDQATLEEVYGQLVELYNNEGVQGLHEFMVSSGILGDLGMDTDYIDFVLAYEDGGWEGAEAYARARGLVTTNDELRLILVLESEDTAEVVTLVTEFGATVLREYENQVEVGIPLTTLQEAAESEEAFLRLVGLAQLPGVVKVRVPQLAVTSQRDEVGEGPEVTGAEELHRIGITGEGIKVGVIDPGGFFGLLDLIDVSLPPAERIFIPEWQDAEYLTDFTDGHGTACAEIVYEMAPDVELYLAHAPTYLELIDAVDWMIANDVDIINYSAGNMVEPIDGTGWSVEVADYAIDNGILWVNAMGNQALSHLDMVFTDTNGDGFHEFPHGDELLPIQPLSPLTEIALSWNEEWGGASQDYDLYLFREDGDELELVGSSRELQSGGSEDIPVELVRAEVEDEVHYVAIQAVETTEDMRLNLVGYANDFKYSMPEGSISSPADGPRVLAVGATNWRNDRLEEYSSQGPTWDGRIKPEISAPADVSNTIYDMGFTGTSASAPHVAGAAALVMQQGGGDLSNGEVIEILLSNSLDLGEDGQDNEFGFGRLNLDEDLSVESTTVTTEGEGAGEFLLIYDELNVESGREYGLVVYTDLVVGGIADGEVVVEFVDESGRLLYEASTGFSVDPDEVTYISGIETFASYDDFDIPVGETEITYQATLVDSSGNPVAVSDPGVFYLTLDGPPSDELLVEISNVSITPNVTYDGETGFEIALDLNLQNAGGLDTEVVAVFFEDNSRERPLRDFNDQYELDGVVATGVVFEAASDNEFFEQGTLFIPNEELHLASDSRYKLKVVVGVFIDGSDDPAAVSEWVPFRVDTSTWE